MSEKPDGGPAFPTVTSREQLSADGYRTIHESENGMALRDYFAAHALNACISLLSGPHCSCPPPAWAATEAYRYADAMLAERAK